MIAYCVACKGPSEIVDPKSVTMANGRPATEGRCGNLTDGAPCGTRLYVLGGNTKLKHGTNLPMKHVDVDGIVNQMALLGWAISINTVAPEAPENFKTLVRVTVTCHRDAEGKPVKEVGVGNGFVEALHEVRLKMKRHDHAQVEIDDEVLA
jgi:hypothetical protein